MTRIEYRAGVAEDIRMAFDWYDARQPGLGDRYLAAVNRTVERLRTRPVTFSRVYRDVRAIRVKRFQDVVYYRVLTDQIIVLAVRHGKRLRTVLRERY